MKVAQVEPRVDRRRADWSRAQWLAHDIAQGEFYVGIMAEKIAVAGQRYEQVRVQRQLAEAPEWVDGPHTDEEVRAARDAEWAATIEVSQLTDRRNQMLRGVEDMKAEQRTSASAAITQRQVPMTRARTVSRPRECRYRRTVSRCSSSSGDDPSDSDDPEPPALGGRQTPARARGPP